MITYPRGSLTATPIGERARVATEAGPATFEVLLDPGPLEIGDDVIAARALVRMGVEDLDVTMLLGARDVALPDPAGPLGLAATPIVVLPDDRWSDLVVAGVTRAGRRPPTALVAGDLPSLGIRMLEAVGQGAEAIVVESGGGPHLTAARVLGGRPVAVLPLDGDVARYLAGCRFDVHVPIPGIDEPQRSHATDRVRPLELERTHHLLEVDPTPAFEEARRPVDGASLDALSAAAAGVLAGRLAVGNRRWRTEAGS